MKAQLKLQLAPNMLNIFCKMVISSVRTSLSGNILIKTTS